METTQLGWQADLFDAGPPTEAPPKDFVARIRAELRLRSVAGWLPAGEAEALRAAFETELDRLYAAADAAAIGQAAGPEAGE